MKKNWKVTLQWVIAIFLLLATITLAIVLGIDMAKKTAQTALSKNNSTTPKREISWEPETSPSPFLA